MSDIEPARPAGRIRLRWKVVALIALAALVIIGARLFHLGKREKPAAPPPAIPAVLGRVGTRDMPIWLTGIGSVTPINVVDVKARVDGMLVRVDFREGEEVPAGRLLALIDPRPYAALLAQARATRAKDAAQLVNANQEVTRTTTLAQAGAGTKQAADAAVATAAALRATVAADDAVIRQAALNLRFCRIEAPIAGRVGIRQVNPGSIVHASDTTGLVTVTQMAPISILFALPQDALPAILDGQRKAPLPVAAYSRDGSTHLVDGSLTFVGSAVDPTTGQFQLRANFVNAARTLWPGEFVSARALARTDRAAVVVPDQAVQTSEQGRFVYVVGSDRKVAMRSVRAGPSVNGFTEILSGLRPGETIVISGQSRLSPGSLVTTASAR